MGERRQFSAQCKAERVLEWLNGTPTPAEIGRTQGIKPSLWLAWRKRLVEPAAKRFERESDRDPAQARIGTLERLVGRLTLELDVAKKASNLWRTPRLGSGRG
jgi:transposase-like protein